MAAASFNGVPDASVIALAHLVLKRAKLKLPSTMRTQAVAILLNPSRSTGLARES